MATGGMLWLATINVNGLPNKIFNRSAQVKLHCE
jgi:hypothetical protein